MREFLAYYSDHRHDEMNEYIIRDFKLQDNMVEKIEELCRELEKILHDNLTYIGVEFDDSKNRFREANAASKKRDSKTGKLENATYVNVNYTYSRMAVFHFKVRFKDPRTGDVSMCKADMPVYIPQFYDDYHYYIRGNLYSAPLQLIDSLTYQSKDNGIVLKTLTRAIKLSKTRSTITDAHGLPFKTDTFYLHMGKKKIPFLLFYFSYFGFFRTLQFFGCDKYIKLYYEAPVDPDEKTIFFKFGKYFLGVERDTFNTNYLLRQFVSTVLALGRKNLDLDDIRNVYYWMRTLGAYISQTKPYDQGSALLTTFITCLDARTIINVNRIVGGSKKDTPWTILRWMFLDYATLSAKNTSLKNKRLRYTEYLIAPLVREVQMKLYRYLRTRPKMRDMKRLLDILKISSSIICHSIIGKNKNKQNALNITKYSTQTNDLVLVGSALKWSKAGPQSAIERTTAKRASVQMRQMDVSSLGILDQISFSSGTVGLSGNLCAYCDIDPKTLTFKFKDQPAKA